MEQNGLCLESATAETLRSLLWEELRELESAQSHFRWMLAVTALLHLAAFGLLMGEVSSEGLLAALMLLIAWGTAPFLFVRYEVQKASRKHVFALVSLLHKYRTRSSIGVLIAAMQAGDSETTALARQAVIAILPELTPEDTLLLGRRQRAYLYATLHGSNAELILATLHALEKVGDAHAIHHVRRLIPCPVWLVYNDRIEMAARQCLQALEARKGRQQTRKTLLRAGVPGWSAEELLRPAQSLSGENRSYLLQAASIPETMVAGREAYREKTG